MGVRSRQEGRERAGSESRAAAACAPGVRVPSNTAALGEASPPYLDKRARREGESAVLVFVNDRVAALLLGGVGSTGDAQQGLAQQQDRQEAAHARRCHDATEYEDGNWGPALRAGALCGRVEPVASGGYRGGDALAATQRRYRD